MNKTGSKRGALIVLEGCDRSGKSTQCELLVRSLAESGVNVKSIRCPERTTRIGEILNDYLNKKIELNHKTVQLLFSANRWELGIESLLKQGFTLICDRYAYSGVVYGSIKDDKDEQWYYNLDSGLPKPDAVFFLDLDLEIAAKRDGYGYEIFENINTQKAVYKKYLDIMSDIWQMIDANKEKDDLHQVMLTKTKQVIKNVANKPIQHL